MPWFLPLIGLIQSMSQQNQLAGMRSQMMNAMQMSPEEEAGIRQTGTANVKSALSRRGLMDSGILGSAIAGIEPEIARIKGQRAAGSLQGLSGMYAAEANQPSFLGSLLPFALKYGVTGFGGPNDYLFKPEKLLQETP